MQVNQDKSQAQHPREDTLYDFYTCLSNEICAYYSTPQFHYRKCYIAKFKNDQVEIDCRLNGAHWLKEWRRYDYWHRLGRFQENFNHESNS